jgi:ATP-dependent Clp protease, protease subunit
MKHLWAFLRPLLLLTGICCVVGPPLCFPQAPSQPDPPTPPKPVVVQYFYGVDVQPITQLLMVVGNQVRMGNKDIIILMSSNGGDPGLAFTAYNYLRGLNAHITTINIGNIDSAAMILFCAGQERYAVPGTRFLIHGVMFNYAAPGMNVQPNAEQLEANLSLVRNLNEEMILALSQNSSKKPAELRELIQGQVILDPNDAASWNLIKGTKTLQNMVPPDAQMVGINVPIPDPLPSTPSAWNVPGMPVISGTPPLSNPTH